MQPQQVSPTTTPQLDRPPISSTALTTDQMIAQENARVFVFEHGAVSEVPQQHKVLDFIHQVSRQRRPLMIGIVACILMSAGGVFAFTKLQTHTKASKTQASAVASSDSSSSAGGVDTPDDTAKDSADSSETDSSTDTADDTSDTSDEETTDEEGTGNTEDTSSNEAEEEAAEEEEAEPIDEVGSPVEDVSTPAPTPVPATPSVTLAHKFTTASWNSNEANKLVVGDEVKSIMSKTQVLGLQEVHESKQRASISSKAICSSCAYSGYMASYSSSAASASSYPIIWTKTSFTQVGSGSSRKMCEAAKTSKYSYAARYATWVKLQSKVNGKQFYVVNTHLMGVGESAGKPGSDTLLISRYKAHMTNLVALVDELKAANIPIYIVGSFNVNYRYDRTVKTSYFPYISLGAIGVRSNWDLLSLSGISSSAGTQGTGSRLIDYVLTWQRSDVTSNSIALSTSRHGSDQFVVFYTSTIK